MNKKKIIIITISILTVIVILGCIFYIYNKNKFYESYHTITSSDGKFTISIPNNIKYKINSIPENNFTVDLYSEKDNMFMYATNIEKKRELDLYEVASDDKTSYFKDKENIREDTGITETNISGNKAFEYSLIYFDKDYNKDFYCHVVWIETTNNIYIMNFEVENKNAENFKKEFVKIQNSFKEL